MLGSACNPGDLVWAHTGSEASFERGVVERVDNHKGTISIKLKTSTIDVKQGDVHKMNASNQDGLPDNTYLRELNEATLLHNVRTRYNDEKDDGGCYSVTGHILIAVNPFRKLAIYEDSNVRSTPSSLHLAYFQGILPFAEGAAAAADGNTVCNFGSSGRARLEAACLSAGRSPSRIEPRSYGVP